MEVSGQVWGMFPIWDNKYVAASGGVSMCMGTIYGLFKGIFFVGCVVWQSKGCSRSCYFGVGSRTEVNVVSVVGDVYFTAKEEVDWVTMDYTFDIEANVV